MLKLARKIKVSVFRAFCLHSGFRVPGSKAGSGTLRHVSRHSATVKSRSNNHGNRCAPRFSQEHPPQSKAGLSAVCAFLHTPRQNTNFFLGGVIIKRAYTPKSDIVFFPRKPHRTKSAPRTTFVVRGAAFAFGAVTQPRRKDLTPPLSARAQGRDPPPPPLFHARRVLCH